MSGFDISVNVLRDLLSEGARRLGPLNIINELKLKSSKDEADLFLIKSTSILNESSRMAVAIPTTENVYSDELFGKASKEWKDLHEYTHIFVDCFGIYPESQKPSAMLIQSSELIEKLLGISKYLEKELDENETKKVHEEFISRNLRLVEQTATKHYELGTGGSALTHLIEWAESPPHSAATGILILGERGIGKTWLLKEFAYSQNSRFLSTPWDTTPVIYIRLEEYAKNLIEKKGIEKSLSYFIASHTDNSRTASIYFWDTLIATGHIIVLFDGFDEISSEFTDDDLVEHLRWLGDSLPGRSRSVITSRGTRFSSPDKIFSIFQGNEPIYRKSDYQSELKERYIPTVTQRQYIPLYQICLITPFSSDDFINLNMTTSAKNTVRAIVGAKDEIKFIDKQCCTLASIPACAREIINLIEQGITDRLRLFELGLFRQLLISNITKGRANVDIAYSPEGGENLVEDVFGLKERTRILEHIAWFLLDASRFVFDPKLMSFTYLEIENTQFEEVMNDLRTQTVFEYSYEYKNNGLKFVNKAIFAYFAARYIFSRLASKNRVQDGLKSLGRHKLACANPNSLEEMIFDFLKLFFKHGMLSVDTPDCIITASLNKNSIQLISLDNLKYGGDSLLNEKPRFLTWLQHLPENIQSLEKLFKEYSLLNKYVALKKKWRKSKTDIYLEDGVFLANPKGETFCIAEREVTNEEFDMFLNSPWKPIFTPINENPEKRKITFRKTEAFSHPLIWDSIHRTSQKNKNGFHHLTNDYHLFSWTKGIIPSNQDEPVCWLSAFVIAVYCNWKTLVFCDENDLDADSHMAYQIVLDEDHIPKIYLLYDQESGQPNLGYRMPLIREWSFAARGGDTESKYPWSKYANSSEIRLKRKGKLLREFLTQPTTMVRSVYSSLPNGFGIHGMIGNVREWVYNGEHPNKNNIQKGQIMGATAQLGEETFAYDHPGNPLPMYNTNLDVGFRWARSLPKNISEGISNLLNERK